MEKMHIKLNVNGKDVDLLTEPRTLLIHALREELEDGRGRDGVQGVHADAQGESRGGERGGEELREHARPHPPRRGLVVGVDLAHRAVRARAPRGPARATRVRGVRGVVIVRVASGGVRGVRAARGGAAVGGDRALLDVAGAEDAAPGVRAAVVEIAQVVEHVGAVRRAQGLALARAR